MNRKARTPKLNPRVVAFPLTVSTGPRPRVEPARVVPIFRPAAPAPAPVVMPGDEDTYDPAGMHADLQTLIEQRPFVACLVHRLILRSLERAAARAAAEEGA